MNLFETLYIQVTKSILFLQLEDYDEDDFIPDTEPLQQFSSHIGGIYKVILHPLDEETFASCSTDCRIKIWNFVESKGGQHISLNGHFGYVVDITWLSTGWRLASASHDGSVKIWDTQKGLCYDIKILSHNSVSKIGQILILTNFKK